MYIRNVLDDSNNNYLRNLSDKEKEFGRLIVENIAYEIADKHGDTVCNACADFTSITADVIPGIATDGFIPYTDGGFSYNVMANMGIASSESLPESVKDELDNNIKNAEMDYFYENNIEEETEDTYSTEEYYEYERNYLDNINYYYQVQIYKDRETGKMRLDVFINFDEYGRTNKNTAGNYTKYFTISDNLSTDSMEKIIDAVVNDITSDIWNW